MGIFNKKIVTVGGEVLPDGIIQLEDGRFQVKGRVSCHPTLAQALKQLEGMQNAKR